MKSYFEKKSELEKKKVIELYQLKIDSLNLKNTILLSDIKSLDYKIDSLKKLKMKIYWKYEEKAKIIFDANAGNHAMWLDSICSELDYIKN